VTKVENLKNREPRLRSNGILPSDGLWMWPLAKSASMPRAVVVLVVMLAMPAVAQESRRDEAKPLDPISSLKAKMHVEADQVGQAEVSPLFTAFTGREVAPAELKGTSWAELKGTS
jgi:hypothetical protein